MEVRCCSEKSLDPVFLVASAFLELRGEFSGTGVHTVETGLGLDFPFPDDWVHRLRRHPQLSFYACAPLLPSAKPPATPDVLVRESVQRSDWSTPYPLNTKMCPRTSCLMYYLPCWWSPWRWTIVGQQPRRRIGSTADFTCKKDLVDSGVLRSQPWKFQAERLHLRNKSTSHSGKGETRKKSRIFTFLNPKNGFSNLENPISKPQPRFRYNFRLPNADVITSDFRKPK